MFLQAVHVILSKSVGIFLSTHNGKKKEHPQDLEEFHEG